MRTPTSEYSWSQSTARRDQSRDTSDKQLHFIYQAQSKHNKKDSSMLYHFHCQTSIPRLNTVRWHRPDIAIHFRQGTATLHRRPIYWARAYSIETLKRTIKHYGFEQSCSVLVHPVIDCGRSQGNTVSVMSTFHESIRWLLFEVDNAAVIETFFTHQQLNSRFILDAWGGVRCRWWSWCRSPSVRCFSEISDRSESNVVHPCGADFVVDSRRRGMKNVSLVLSTQRCIRWLLFDENSKAGIQTCSSRQVLATSSIRGNCKQHGCNEVEFVEACKMSDFL